MCEQLSLCEKNGGHVKISNTIPKSNDVKFSVVAFLHMERQFERLLSDNFPALGTDLKGEGA